MTDDLVAKLRDEDSYYRLQEKHWCIDAEELERQRLAAADRIEALEAENERLREAIKPFARAQHIVASIDEDRIRCVLTYPPEATHTFTLASLDEARAALRERQ